MFKYFICILILVASYFKVFATSYSSDQIIKLQAVFSWAEARNLCKSYGQGWDLPTVSDIIDGRISQEELEMVFYRTLSSEDRMFYNLVWARSNEEDLNKQLLDSSQALKFYPADGTINSYILSEFIIEKNKLSLDLMIRNFESIVRSDKDHFELVQFLEVYNSTEFGQQFPIDKDRPLIELPAYIKMLPPSLLPEFFFDILTRPSAQYLSLVIDNLKYEIDTLSEGLQTFCVWAGDF